MSVSVFGWMRSATQSAMMARSGNMQAAPIAPVKVMLRRSAARSTSSVADVCDWHV